MRAAALAASTRARRSQLVQPATPGDRGSRNHGVRAERTRPTGYGRLFAHADDRNGRYNAINDVLSCVGYLLEAGIADPGRIAVSGRTYGGYLTLAALVRYPPSSRPVWRHLRHI